MATRAINQAILAKTGGTKLLLPICLYNKNKPANRQKYNKISTFIKKQEIIKIAIARKDFRRFCLIFRFVMSSRLVNNS
jgi:hypothetical protein